jgi:iron(III) transport system ATP-binding protein
MAPKAEQFQSESSDVYASRADDARDGRMALLLQNIRHAYGTNEVVRGVSLQVASGEILSLFGPSGCGKTTVLRLIAGLERLKSGAILLDRQALADATVDISPERRPVGLVFQDLVLFPHLTAAENVAFGLAELAPAERRERAFAELAAVGLTGLEDRYPNQLSGGQQQRVALARALARRPRALLLDEPFAGVDPTVRKRLRDDLRRLLKNAGAPTVFVTHDADEALAVADRIAVMSEGRILETASPRELYEAPKTVQGAALIPGAQRLAARIANGVVETAFGSVALDTKLEGLALVVALPGGVNARPAAGGACTVVEARFAAPGWTLLVQAKSGERIEAAASEALLPGAGVAVDFDPRHLRVFAA